MECPYIAQGSRAGIDKADKALTLTNSSTLKDCPCRTRSANPLYAYSWRIPDKE